MTRLFATADSFPLIMPTHELAGLSVVRALGAAVAWEPVRAVRRKTVYFGYQGDSPAWIAKVSLPGERGFARALEFARLVDDRIAAGALPGFVPCQADLWQIHDLSDGRVLLLAPFIAGSPLGNEAILDEEAARDQQARLGDLVRAIVALDQLGRPSPRVRRLGQDLRSSIRSHLRHAAAAGLLAASAAEALECLSRVLPPPSQAVAAHNDFAPWHAVGAPTGLAFIDGEHYSEHCARGVDLAHCAMFIWVTQEHPAQAQALISMAAEVLAIDQRTLWRDSALVWLRMVAKAFEISISWNGNAAEARAFALWILDRMAPHLAPRHRTLAAAARHALDEPLPLDRDLQSGPLLAA